MFSQKENNKINPTNKDIIKYITIDVSQKVFWYLEGHGNYYDDQYEIILVVFVTYFTNLS